MFEDKKSLEAKDVRWKTYKMKNLVSTCVSLKLTLKFHCYVTRGWWQHSEKLETQRKNKIQKRKDCKAIISKHCFKCHVSVSCYDDNDDGGVWFDGSFNPHDISMREVLYCSHFTYDETVGDRQNNLPTVIQLDTRRT